MIELARKIDHLSPGVYIIEVVKTPAPADWRVEIKQVVDNSPK